MLQKGELKSNVIWTIQYDEKRLRDLKKIIKRTIKVDECAEQGLWRIIQQEK